MIRRYLIAFMLIAMPVATALAEGFDRPIPQPQSATAELWYAVAALMLCAALYAVHKVVSRR